MHLSHLTLAALALAATTLLLGGGPQAAHAPNTPPQDPLTPPRADGHYVLVVQGDRNGLTITHANRKVDPYAGTPKGLTSDWRLTIHDAAGALLADVPLDVSPFDTRPEAVGRGVRVEGCQVHDSHIAMLVNAPRFAEAASYRFARGAAGTREVVLGTYDAALVRALAEDVR